MRDPAARETMDRPMDSHSSPADSRLRTNGHTSHLDSTNSLYMSFRNNDKRQESKGSVMERYSGALEMLRSQLWNNGTVGNVTFEEGEPDANSMVGHMGGQEEALSQINPVERDLCAVSSVFVKSLLLNYDKVPLGTVDDVLRDTNVVQRLRILGETYSFGRRVPIPRGKLDQVFLNTVREATAVFNGSTIPVVMWPCMNNMVDHNEQVRIDESVLVEAIQVYRLLKHNRMIYVEWGRNTAMTSHDEGPLPMDITDGIVIREISDTIIDELSSTLWCLSYLSLQLHSAGNKELKSYAESIIQEPKAIIDALWSYYLAFSSHMKERYSHIKDIDRSLNEKLPGRLIVETHRVLKLQCQVVKTLLAVHMGTKNMSYAEYQRYASHFQKRHFTGVLPIARTIIGAEHCNNSMLLTHAAQELQTLGTLLLSSFFLYDAYGHANSDGLTDAFFDESLDLIKTQMSAIDSGKEENRASPMLLFAYACFMNRLPQDHPRSISSPRQDLNFVKYMDLYSESLEWIAHSRDLFGSSEYGDMVESFPSRLLMMASVSQFIETFGVAAIRRLDSVVHAVCALVNKADVNFTRSYYLSKKTVLERISEYLMSHFPFGLHILFQLLGALLPTCVEPVEDSGMDVDSDNECVELIIRYLCTSFKTITVSPAICDLGHAESGLKLELSSGTYIGIQMLYMLGFDKQMMVDNWNIWNMGSNLYLLKSGSLANLCQLDSLRHLSYQADCQVTKSKEDLWLVDTGLNMLKAVNPSEEDWLNRVSNENVQTQKPRLFGCKLDLDICTNMVVEDIYSQEDPPSTGSIKFTLLRAIWLVWHASIRYMVDDLGPMPMHTLQTFVTCNGLMTSLIMKYPRVASLMESNITSSLYSGDGTHNASLGPSNLIYNCTLLFLVALKRTQLRIVLPEVLDALHSLLKPAYVVPVGENATEVEFSRFWVFFQSLENCYHIMGDENNFHMFTLLSRVMQEEERGVNVYPVTSRVLKLFKDLLHQCPPELWMLSAWHHGMLNMSHTSLEMESNNLTHGLGLTYLRSLKHFIDSNHAMSSNLYSSFQSLLLCEMFSYVLKGVGLGIAECEFTNTDQRLDMIRDVIEIARLVCRIFRVSNYEIGKQHHAEMEEDREEEDSWVQGTNELINRILLIFSESNYIMEVINILGHQIDLLHNKKETGKGALVMVNPLLFSDKSLSFFTARTLVYRRMGLVMRVSKDNNRSHVRQCLTNCKYSWLSKPKQATSAEASKETISAALKLLQELYVTALPKTRNPLFATLADTLGSAFFVKSRSGADHRRRLMLTSEQIHDMNDPVVYFAMRQLGMLCVKLPQVSLLHSLFTHTYTTSHVSVATDLVSLYLLLREQSKMKTKDFIEHEIHHDRLLLQKLGQIRGNYDVIALIEKEQASFYEHLIAIFFASKNCNYEARISILQYLLVALSTCSGMELLIRNKGLDINALLEFVDTVLCHHVVTVQNHNLGDITLAQFSLLLFCKLVELSRGAHNNYCWQSVHQALRTLVNLWRRVDSNLFVDSDGALNQQTVVPKTSMAKELWFDRSKVDYYIDIEDSILERRLGLLRTMCSLYAVMGAMTEMVKFINTRDRGPSDDFLTLLAYLSMNWDFMDTLFPIVVYDSGFVDTYVKNDFTEVNMRQYYRLGLWLGEDCLAPLSRFLHYLNDMNIQSHYLLMQGVASALEPMDIREIMSTVISNKIANFNRNYSGTHKMGKLGVDTYVNLLAKIVGPPETNGVSNLKQIPRVNREVNRNSNADAVPTDDRDLAFYMFGTSYEFGYNYLMDVEKLHHFSVVLLTSRDDNVNFLLSREMPNVRRCIELVPYIESVNEMKVRILSKLCELVDGYRSLGSNIKLRVQQLVSTEGRVGNQNSMRMANCSIKPFEMFAFNGAMLLQLVLTRPNCITENPVYVGLLLEFMELLFSDNISLNSIESSFISYYECYSDTDLEDGGIVDYIVSRDQVTASDKVTVGEEFRLFAVNVFGGLAAQLARYMVEFGARYQEILDVDMKTTDKCRASLKVRLAALESCLQYQHSCTNTMDGSVIGGFNRMEEHNQDARECICNLASGKGVNLNRLSVWLNFKIAQFFGPLYKIFINSTRSSQGMEHDPEEEGALDVYHRVTKYTVKSISQCCTKMFKILYNESEYVLKCFLDAGIDLLRNGELEKVHIFVLGPFALLMVLESVVCTDFNRHLLQVKSYDHILEMAESLARLPYTASMCMFPSENSAKPDSANFLSIMKQDRNYMADRMKQCEKGIFHYENHNWLRAALHKCLERLNHIFMYCTTCKTFMSTMIESRLLQRLYLYSFLAHFVQPLQFVTPKAMLSRYSDQVDDKIKGNFAEVIEHSITMWYPPYQAYGKKFLVRCPYHALHCGMLRFAAQACNFEETERQMPSAHREYVTSWIIELLQLMRMRIQHVFQTRELNLALLEESNLFFSLLRHIRELKKLSHPEVIQMKEIIQWSLEHFNAVVLAFQNGIDKLSHNVKPMSEQELQNTGDLPLLVKPSLELTPTSTLKKQNDNETSEQRPTQKPPGVYKQRCLYLVLKSAEWFFSFLMNLGFTVDCEANLPPRMDQFLKTGDPSASRRMYPVNRDTFRALLNGTLDERPPLRKCDYQQSAYSHEVTFEIMTKAFNRCVEICTLVLRLFKEVCSTSRPEFIVAFTKNGKQYMPLSLSVQGVGEYQTEVMGKIRCAIYKEIKVTPESHVDVIPAVIPLEDLISLFERVIEKSLLFSGRVVNTAFLQNQLSYQPENRAMQPNRNGKHIQRGAELPVGAQLHDSLTLLNNAFSEIAVHPYYFSKSMIEFCSIMEGFVSRRLEQTCLLTEVFNARYIYLEG